VNCKDFLKELTDYLDGNISVTVREELDEHLHWCRDCHVVLNTTKKTIEIYRDNRLYELPEKLRQQLQQAIITRCKTTKQIRKSSS
jgi:anti-sigma factor RsiW